MAYPERLLSENETIESQFRPHWSGIANEILIVLAGLVVAIVLALITVPWWAYLILVVLTVAVALGGFVKWYNTEHVITDERLIYRAGFFAKRGTEIPLEVIQNVAFNQTVFERLLGTGDLMIESAGTHGQTRYRDIPRPEAVQSLIYRMREQRMMAIENGPHGGAPESVASQLERLARLHDDGKLTDDEFARQKARLMEEN